jgi:tape measure domain-containing protein
MAGKRDDLEIVIGADLDGLAADLKKGSRLIADFGRDAERSTPRARDFSNFGDIGGLKNTSRHAKESGNSIRSLAGEMTGFAGKAAIAGGVLLAMEAGISGVSDVFRHLKESVSMAAELEQTTLAFDVMLGSAERAKDMVAGMRKFAAETPFNSREVTGAGKQLLAYGVAAEQIIPTMRMLGDVSAAFGKDMPLKDLTYLYGTLFAQQRAYAVDIRQFAGRGIPIYEELAKAVGKSADEVKDLVEQGRIGRDEVTKAFIAMTSAGGRFFKMTERQAETLAGTWEQMTDAFDLAKVKLGQIIIEEAGLKGVVKDLEAFGKRIELGIDTTGLREGIRFVGNLGKGVAQLAYETTRFGGIFADVFGNQLNVTFPEMAKAFRDGRDFVATLQDVKFDGTKMTDFAIDFGEIIIKAFATAANLVLEVGRNTIKYVVGPAIFAVGQMRPIIAAAGLMLGKSEMVQTNATKATLWLLDFVVHPPLFGGKATEAGQARPAIDHATNTIIAGGDDWIKQQLEAFDKLINTIKPNTDALKDFRAILKESRIAKAEAEKMDALRALANKQYADMEVSGAAMNALHKGMFGQMMAINPISPLAGLAHGGHAMRSEFAFPGALDIAGAFMGMEGFGKRFMTAFEGRGGGVQLMNDPRPGGAEATKALREKYDPLADGGRLMEYKADIDDQLKRGRIDPAMHELGWRDAVKDVADRLGVGQPARFTNAALVGSQEDARLLANFMAGQTKTTTDDLLKQIRDVLIQIKQSASQTAGQPLPQSADFGGGGDF